ncbi:hypothetical protein BB561_001442 [Smittium simulii]|uniref:Phospholipase A-2-activating protein n=1 Tax=Smittium simulii TaxID=133385 RepID=A0A2T9YUM5_9FUNG|nr:hypothetical protein BB561_001442 [Smittium simulii]
MFKLSGILKNHTSDVRGIASLHDEYIATASRDKTVCLWAKEGSSQFVINKVLIAHNGYVNSAVTNSHYIYYRIDYIITAGSDKIIYVWDIAEATSPAYTLAGHTDNVCALSSFKNGGLISGSWDKTARVWVGFKNQYILSGHSAAVWAVLELKDNSVLTGSADKTIKRWNDGKLTQTYVGHEDCVRALVLNSDNSFVSASNDGSIRVWGLNGDCLVEFFGHESFIYSLAYLPTGEIISSSEDRTVRVWKDGNNIQTIILPATSIWCVSTLSNGDITCGTSDGNAYIFTRNQDRIADKSTTDIFNNANSNFAESKKVKDSLNTDKLPGPERLLEPGTKDQQVIMIKDGVLVVAYQWDLTSNSWAKVGVVTDAIGQERKQLFEGKEYDYVFSVDLEDGMPIKKLPYNVTENPYDAAQKFINKYEISQTYLDEIVKFIISNSEGIQFDNKGSNSDPFTGNNRYIPGEEIKQLPAKENIEFNRIPNYILMIAGKPQAILKKVIEFNSILKSQEPEYALSDQQLDAMDSLVSILENPNDILKKKITGFPELRKTLFEWPLKYRFPSLDILRLVASQQLGFHLVKNEIFGDYGLDIFIENVAKLSEFNNEESSIPSDIQIRSTMIIRMLANLLTFDSGQKEVITSLEGFIALFQKIQSKKISTNLMIAISSFYINFVIAVRNFVSDSSKDKEAGSFTETVDIASALVFESISSWIFTLVKDKHALNLNEFEQIEKDTLTRLISIIGEFLLINKQRYSEFAKNRNVIEVVRQLSIATAIGELSKVSSKFK